MTTFRITLYPGDSMRIEVVVVAETVDQAKVQAVEKVIRLVDKWKTENIWVPCSFREVTDEVTG